VYRGKHKTIKELRSRVANASSPMVKQRPWILQVPYDVRDGAIGEFVKNLMTEIGKVKATPSFRFWMSFKNKTDSSMSFPVLKKLWKDGAYFPRFLSGKLTGYEAIPPQLECDSKIVKTRTNDFFICIPTTRPTPAPAPWAYEGSCIALDPGVRTFLTGYDPSGRIVEIGKGDVEAVFRMCYRVDRIMAKVAKAKNHKQRYQRKRAACRARTKLQRCILDLHAKAAKYLCETYELIFLPKFTTQQMVRRANRKIRSKTARMMLTFAHYKFRQRLLDKARNYDNVQVVIVNEAYTSKTCTKCGTIKTNLGGNKTFNCSSCSWKGDRDINGARNIYIRSVVEAESFVILPSGPTPPTTYSFGAFKV
jgi:putative transposase